MDPLRSGKKSAEALILSKSLPAHLKSKVKNTLITLKLSKLVTRNLLDDNALRCKLFEPCFRNIDSRQLL